MEDIEQLLIEHMADFLDDSYINTIEAVNHLNDPVVREESELHIRMAKAAMVEYKRTMK